MHGMTRFISRPFKTKPADAEGKAILIPVAFRAANNLAQYITMQTFWPDTGEERAARLKLRASKAALDEVLSHRGDPFGPGGPFNDGQLDAAERCADGTYWDSNDCLPPLPPNVCKKLQKPFEITDCHDHSSPLRGSAFLVTGVLEKYPKDMVVEGTIALLF